MHATDIVGYTFNAANYCGDCIIDALPTGDGEAFDGWALAEGADPMTTEDNLTEIATAFGINREDESSFDSSEFPKVIFASSVEGDEPCDTCCDDLVTGEHVFRGTAVSSNHHSVDGQTIDAMSHLEHHHREVFDKIMADFPEYKTYKLGQHSSWFDTDAMGVDSEWGSWLADAIQMHSPVTWEDGEPYCTDRECCTGSAVAV